MAPKHPCLMQEEHGPAQAMPRLRAPAHPVHQLNTAAAVNPAVAVKLTAAAVNMPAADTSNPQLLHSAARLCLSGGTDLFRRFAFSEHFGSPAFSSM